MTIRVRVNVHVRIHVRVHVHVRVRVHVHVRVSARADIDDALRVYSCDHALKSARSSLGEKGTRSNGT